jgi:hypothetical protein
MAAEERSGKEGTRSGAFWLSLKAGALYFALMFAVGWITGPVRELLLIPLFGRVTGIAAEAMLMIGAMVVVLHGINWLLKVPSAISTRAIMGLVALGLLLPAEMVGAWMLRGQTPAEFLFPPNGFFAVVQWGLLFAFAAMPLLVRRPWTFGDEIAS